MSSLTRIVPLSHQLVREVLQPGDLAIDLTAGKGRDTLVLARTVGSMGQVVAFDVQESALQQTDAFLAEHGFKAKRLEAGQDSPDEPGVYLIKACHSHLQGFLTRPAKAIMANLGYLPGGDQSLITQPETTLSALRQSLELLVPGGRLAVTIYPAHPGGAEEASAVDEFFSSLPQDDWQVLLLKAANRPEAPYLIVAESTQSSKQSQ